MSRSALRNVPILKPVAVARPPRAAGAAAWGLIWNHPHHQGPGMRIDRQGAMQAYRGHG